MQASKYTGVPCFLSSTTTTACGIIIEFISTPFVLQVLSLGRNLLKSLQGIEAVADNLEQLWVSYNQIDKLKPLRNLSKLKGNRNEHPSSCKT